MFLLITIVLVFLMFICNPNSKLLLFNRVTISCSFPFNLATSAVSSANILIQSEMQTHPQLLAHAQVLTQPGLLIPVRHGPLTQGRDNVIIVIQSLTHWFCLFCRQRCKIRLPFYTGCWRKAPIRT